jgi:hypothetical protein
MADQVSIRRPDTLPEIFRDFPQSLQAVFQITSITLPSKAFPIQYFIILQTFWRHGFSVSKFLWFYLIASALFYIPCSSMQFITPTSKPHLRCFVSASQRPRFTAIHKKCTVHPYLYVWSKSVSST